MKNIIDRIISSRNSLRTCAVSGLMGLLMLPSAAVADVKTESENGFAILHIGDVKAEPEEIWNRLLLPNRWWSRKHSFSGKSENFYLEPRVNGCFCESLTDEIEDGTEVNNGEVEHLRVILIDNQSVLRMTGALGPLQSEAVNGTLTIAMKANDDGTTKLSFSYIVGGYMRFKVSEISGPVDRVIGEQFGNLTKVWGLVETEKPTKTGSGISLSDDAKLIDGDQDPEEAEKSDLTDETDIESDITDEAEDVSDLIDETGDDPDLANEAEDDSDLSDETEETDILPEVIRER